MSTWVKNAPHGGGGVLTHVHVSQGYPGVLGEVEKHRYHPLEAAVEVADEEEQQGEVRYSNERHRGVVLKVQKHLRGCVDK